MRYFTIIYERLFIVLPLAAACIVFFSDSLIHKTKIQRVAMRASTAHAAERSTNSQRHHVAVLTTGVNWETREMIGLRQGLKEAGYLEGENLTLTVSPNKTYDELKRDIRRYLHENVSVFVTIGATDTDIARTMITTTPVVFMPTRNPVGRELVKSLRRSGTNFTGLSYEGDVNIEGKTLEIFKEVVPRLQRVLVLYEGTHEKPISAGSLDPLRETSKRLRIAVTEVAVRTHSEIESAVVNLRQSNSFGVYVICTKFFASDRITPSIAKDRRIPFFGCLDQVEKFGGLLSYGPDYLFLGRQGARYVAKILQGAKPQELPVETPRKYELVINLKTADAIGLQIPPVALQQADRVIE